MLFALFLNIMNTYLDIQHLTKSVGDRILFSDISFSIQEGDRMGLIAQNGTGKTTLLNILMGKDAADSGSVIFQKDLKVGYLTQSFDFSPGQTVLDACFQDTSEICQLISKYENALLHQNHELLPNLLEEIERRNGWELEQRAKQILTLLNITKYDKPMCLLSGGQVKRVALAKVLLSDSDLLIMDEPTNHLDLKMIEWLEAYLQKQRRALLVVTHDRYFLDRICNQILELDNNTLYVYKGNYEYYLEKRDERIAVANANLSRAKNLYRKELAWMRRTPSARSSKSKYRKETFLELQKQARHHKEESLAGIGVKTEYIGSKIFEAQYVSKRFKNSTAGSKEIIILRDFYYTFSRYEKLGIVGDNGTGKSTFVKLLLNEIQPDEGCFVIGETVKFGYFSQENMKFEKNMKVIDAIKKIAETIDIGGGKSLTAMQFLSHFLFLPPRQQDYIYKLSGGELRRLHLCVILMQNPNFLILDEPTNDLDINTLQVLEEYLLNFKGCVIVISHDRCFMDKIVDHLLIFKGDGVIDDFPGNYSQYREWLSLLENTDNCKKEENTKQKKTQSLSQSSTHQRKLTFNEKRELEKLEEDLEKLSTLKREVEQSICSGSLSINELTEQSYRLPLIEKEINEKEMRWLELSDI